MPTPNKINCLLLGYLRKSLPVAGKLADFLVGFVFTKLGA